jgi:hypothetical protein
MTIDKATEENEGYGIDYIFTTFSEKFFICQMESNALIMSKFSGACSRNAVTRMELLVGMGGDEEPS